MFTPTFSISVLASIIASEGGKESAGQVSVDGNRGDATEETDEPSRLT